ncbi:uncharacterized protein TRIREDRAFT_109007 [Trichoderma reesei QM6a]|jgi:hypothetical protein|uniref:Predicted protein n=2 Tax=Hypocrea jecorina TaxID=51453 RepID=G0RNL9_HYPJQ|nr:uncharacterized protein TRIREDRAFT_109007 [Trichoderma reesei QM6a]EGR47297.1 predicted protein [Trichoderma reesei QM6a]ETS00622.1 hypothetical protein M419DRAFT_9763 [Trichoderma reesei RUT C-30]
MEPPAKRRRRSQLLLDKDNADEDDDELAFRPFEVEAKRDPDYKLSVERAYADQRFQATMAHIFEKYGRDFEGIGDEIDLVTGEIVVNNGHVRNMRDEGDVGDGLRGDLTDGEDDEDEGILLEDLYDDEEEYKEEAGEKAKPADFAREGAHSGNDADDDDDEDRIIQGRQATRDSHSTALVLGSSSRNSLLARASPFGMQTASPLHFEPPTELPFASSPFSFDRSPFASEPWGFPGQNSDPLWDRPDLFAVQRPPSEQLPLKPSRYQFPARSGKSSIWAPGSRFRADDEEPLPSAFAATFGKHLLPRRRKILKHPLLPPSAKLNEQVDDGRGDAEEDEEDEDEILMGKRSGENPIEASARTGDSRPSNNPAEKEAEEKGGEGTSSDSGYKSAQSTRRSRKRKQRADEGPTRDENLVQPPGISRKPSSREPKEQSRINALKAKESAPTTTALELAEEGNGCRRSGRMRKQVEYLNKIPWAQALAEQKAEKQATLLPASESQTSGDDAHVEEESSTGGDSENEGQAALTGSEHECIPDSAAEDDDEEEEEQGEEKEEEVEGEDEAEDVVEAEKNSDEGGEAEKEEKQRRVPTPLKDLPTSHGPHIRDPDIAEHRHTQAPAGFPFKTTNSGCLLSDDEAPTSLSKPRKSTPKNRHEDVLPLREIRNVRAQAHIELSSSDVSKEERPNHSSKKRRRKADAPTDVSPTASRSSMRHLDAPTEDSSGVAPLSSSPTRFLSRITLNVSLDDTPQPPDAAPDEARHQLEAVPSSSPCARVNEDIPKPTASRRKRRQSKKPVSPVVEQLSAEIAQSKQPAKATALPTVIEDSSYETCDDSSHIEPSSPVKASPHDEPAPSSSSKRTVSPPEAVARPSSQSPTKRAPQSPFKSPTKSPLKRAFAAEPDEPLPSLSRPPQTPRRPKRRLKVPSSRHSILSLLSDDEEEEDEEIDELGRNLAAMPKLQSSVAQSTARKVWRSSSRTREVYHTPVKKRPSEPVSPGSLVKTPGGTLRACGVDGYRCGRDFCFTCL